MFELKVLMIFCLLQYLKVEALNYNDCGSEYDIEEFNIEGCNHSPCYLKKNTCQNMNLVMYSKHKNHELSQQLKVKLRGLNIDLKMNPIDPCRQITCPVVAQNREYLNVTIDLHNFMLFDSDGTMEWRVIDKDNKQILICVEAFVVIKNDVQYEKLKYNLS